jgi:hypothetical protein
MYGLFQHNISILKAKNNFGNLKFNCQSNDEKKEL